MGEKETEAWLLDPEEPSIRFLALRDLQGRKPGDSELRRAQAEIGSRGWVRAILDAQRASGLWASDITIYKPKYVSTNWMLLILADLGITKQDSRVARACEHWMSQMGKPDGGFGPDGYRHGHVCTTGNAVRALVQFGYGDDPRVRRGFKWLVENANARGGWSCMGSGRNLDSWEPMSAFAALPREKWNAKIAKAVEAGANFFLERGLERQGARYAPWYRFHYPVHYYYDLLVGLDFMTALGYGDDPRLRAPLQLLKDKRGKDGRWNLDAVHPDVEGPLAKWFDKHPRQRPTAFALEAPGEPSKMITFRALRVLARADPSRLEAHVDARPAPRAAGGSKRTPIRRLGNKGRSTSP